MAPKVTPGRVGALVAPVIGGGACRWNDDSPAPLFVVPMVRASRLAVPVDAVAVAAVGGMGGAALVVGAVTMWVIV